MTLIHEYTSPSGEPWTSGGRGRPPKWVDKQIENGEAPDFRKKEISKSITSLKSVSEKINSNIMSVIIVDPPGTTPTIVTHLRNSKDHCINHLLECSALTNCKALNHGGRRFLKGEIFDGNFCASIPSFSYVDRKGYDSIFNKIGLISHKSSRNTFKPRKKEAEVIVTNTNGETDSLDNTKFDWMILTQTDGYCAMAVCDRNTVIEHQKRKKDQILSSIPFNKLFWIVHPSEKIAALNNTSNETNDELTELFKDFTNKANIAAKKEAIKSPHYKKIAV